MAAFRTMVEMFQVRSQLKNKGITFIHGEKDERFVSYRELYEQGVYVLGYLQARGLRPGDELIFQLEDNEAFLAYLVACMLGGIIPVPVTQADSLEKLEKLLKIYHILNNPAIVMDAQTLNDLRKRIAEAFLPFAYGHSGERVILADEGMASTVAGEVWPTQPEDIALIQFSSGSTGDPKGVTLTHDNLVANTNSLRLGLETTPEDVMVSWMPLTHDMGLICCALSTVNIGAHLLLMPPSLFVRRPDVFVKKTSEYRGTQWFMPNFAYRHILQHARLETRRDLDLSSVKLIANGAEPVSIHLCQEFLEAMEPFGLSRNVLLPVYGLAEASVGVSAPPIGEGYLAYYLDRRFLTIGETIVETDRNNPNHLCFADVGYPLPNCYVRICDEANRVLVDDTIGYIQISGRHVTQGYYNNPEATAKVKTKDGWVITGDLGFMRNGRLTITGRAKDIIFINGQNYYPHDIERLCEEEVPDIDLGKVAACGVYNELIGTEEVVMFVVFRGQPEKFVKTVDAVRQTVSNRIGLSVKQVIPIARMPRTTSGKVQRFKLCEEYREGVYREVVEKLNRLLAEQNLQREVVKPRNRLEETLMDIWSDVLSVSNISIYDNYLSLGGTSSKLVQVVARVDEVYPGVLTIPDTFSLPTIAQIAEFMEGVLHETHNTKDLVELALIFPLDYVRGTDSPFQANAQRDRFTFALEGDTVEPLRTLAQQAGVQLETVLLSLYIHLLGQMTQSELIHLPVLAGEEDVLPLDIALGEFSTLEELMTRVEKARTVTDSRVYKLQELAKVRPVKPAQSILPFWYNRAQYTRFAEWINFFDYGLEYHERAGRVLFACECKGNRLEKDAMVHLHESFMTLIADMVSQYNFSHS